MRVARHGGAHLGEVPRPATDAAEDTVSEPRTSTRMDAAGAHLRDGRFAEAVEILEALHRDAPDSPALNTLLGRACLGLGDTDSALDHFNLALHYDPRSEAALLGRVEALERRGEGALAERAFESFLARSPLHPVATIGLAWRVYRRGDRDAASRRLEALLASVPESKEALNLLGLILAREYGEFARGETLLRGALDLDAGFDAARANLGWLLGETRRYDEAMACLDSVLSHHPRDDETRLMRAHLNLKRGDFASGWDDFEARHASPDAPPAMSIAPRWNGDPLAGRRLLVTAEQGIGDQIMFASCLPDLLADARAQGGECVIETEARLQPLFQRSFPGANVRPIATSPTETFAPPPEIDCEIPIGSLPARYRRSSESFPAHHGYLKADPARIAYWRRELDLLGPRPHVGISWRGGAPQNRRALRSVDLDLWVPLLRECGTAVSLQYGECESDLAKVRSHPGVMLAHWPDAIADYGETAALVCALDLVISVCTAVVHLTGALGQNAWVMTPWAPEWRYLAAGETMPWYPSVRLFRQAAPGKWRDVLAQVLDSLKALRRTIEGDEKRH